MSITGQSSLPLYYAGCSDPGRVRDHNEDAHGLPNQLGVSPAQVAALGALLIVADGMGGRAAGEEASRLAVHTLYERFYTDPQPDRRAAMSAALAAANTAVKAAGDDDLSKAGMGSTVAALVVTGDKAFVAHAGDSRVYRLRAGKLERLTTDHTWVAESVAAKVITAAEAANHPYRHSLTRALGLEATLNPTLSEWFPLAAGDRFLLCSDGLTNELKESDLARWLREGGPEQAAGQLVERARRAGGRDNITAVVAAVGDGGAAAAPMPVAARGGGRRNGPLLLAGALVGVLIIAAALMVLRRPGEKPAPTAGPTQGVAQTPPSATPTATRPPTSTVAPTATPTPTGTPTPTPRPTIDWGQLADSRIRLSALDDTARGMLQKGGQYQNVCKPIDDEYCQPRPRLLSVHLSGSVSKGNDNQLVFASPFVSNPLSNKYGWAIGDFEAPDDGVEVLWRYGDGKPLLVTSRPDEHNIVKCLHSEMKDFPCDAADRKNTDPGWRATLSSDEAQAAAGGGMPVVQLQLGFWEQTEAGVRFVPEPALTFRLNPRTGEYEPFASPQSP